jgi:hypothetical protein
MRMQSMPTCLALLAILGTTTATHAADPADIAGQWRIVEIAGRQLRKPGTINFTRIRWLGVNTACGAMWGWYRRAGPALRIHVTGTGRLQGSSGSPCGGIDYRLQLGRVRSFNPEAGSLVLLDEQGKVIARLAPRT